MSAENPPFHSEKEPVPNYLYRGITRSVDQLTAENLRSTLRAESVSKTDPTKVGDGNELGVYMSTNKDVAEIYANGSETIESPRYHNGEVMVNGIRLPKCGVVLKIKTKGISIREPEMAPIWQEKYGVRGHYNNGLEGGEWIADAIPAQNYRVLKLVLSKGLNDPNRIEVPVERDDYDALEKAIDIIKGHYEEKKKDAYAFRDFLETLPEVQRFNALFVQRKWAEVRSKS